ncbi:MAG TPA: potassium-transporting ATPase subunit KdpC [Spirochaetia bacterium]|nr:potassium-transporting ATPase subunit KdpC [Spirochaetia bacterium]
MKHVRTAIIVTVFWTIVVGGIYPLLMTGIGAALFPRRVQGSLISGGGKVVGSSLIAQDFTRDIYFHPRPSAVKYDPTGSGASNWGWTSSDLKKAYDQRKSDWQKAYGPGEPPLDMLFASGSGLDPHISPRAAEIQAEKVAGARHLDADGKTRLLALVRRHEEAPQLGFLGEPRVNVLELNVALDKEFPK